MNNSKSSDLTTNSKVVLDEEDIAEKKHYEPPKILSIELLEAVAAVCAPDNAQFGKDTFTCIQSQS